MRTVDANIFQQSGLYIGLEGPDASGKSTVAYRISEITGIPRFHRRSKAFGNPDGYNPKASLGMEWAALKLWNKIGFSMLEERTFLGFAIYNNHEEYTEEIAKELVYMVEKQKAVYVFLQTSGENIHKRLANIGETVQNIDIDIQRYEDFINHMPELYKRLDIRTVDANRSVEEIAWNIIDIMEEKIA